MPQHLSHRISRNAKPTCRLSLAQPFNMARQSNTQIKLHGVHPPAFHPLKDRRLQVAAFCSAPQSGLARRFRGLVCHRRTHRCIPSMSPSMADAVRPRPWRRYACLCSPAAARVRSSPCAGRTSILASMSSASPTPSPVPVQFSSRRRRFSCSERCRDGRTVPGCFPATIGMDASAPTPSTMSGNPPGQGGTGGRSPARPPTQLRLPRPGAR